MTSGNSSKENSSGGSKVRVVARIDQDLSDFLDSEFPRGFRQTYIEQCLKNLRLMIEEGKLPPPSEYARQGTIESVQTLAHS